MLYYVGKMYLEMSRNIRWHFENGFGLSFNSSGKYTLKGVFFNRWIHILYPDLAFKKCQSGRHSGQQPHTRTDQVKSGCVARPITTHNNNNMLKYDHFATKSGVVVTTNVPE